MGFELVTIAADVQTPLGFTSDFIHANIFAACMHNDKNNTNGGNLWPVAGPGNADL